MRVLKSIDWRGVRRMFFSPDGKVLAYDLSVGDSSQQRDVFILAVDGSRETPAVVHPATDIVVGWSPDGSRLLFSSDRTGVIGLWGLSISDGKWFVTNTIDPSRKFVTLMLLSVAGGGPREVFRVELPDRPPFSGWAADSSFVIVRKEKFGGDRASDEYWQIPIPAGEPKKLNLNLKIGNIPWISIHPDGRQVAYTTGENRADVWVMENFLPGPQKGR